MSPSSNSVSGHLAQHDTEPPFEEPWHAQTLAMAFNLIEQGCFDNSTWSNALGASLKRAEASGAPDNTETYYLAVLEALEGLLAETSDVDSSSIDERTEAWRRAYLRTPHGKPVELGS
ncbi:MAG: nitrile hydratase accessory protein [Gammaproteobacteria bacterium]